MPIEVPDNHYCWDGKTPCQFFDNYGGHGSCDLKLGSPDRDKEGYYPKPELCIELDWFTEKVRNAIPAYDTSKHYRAVDYMNDKIKEEK